MNRSIAMALAIICLGSSAAFAQQSASPAPTYMGTVKACEGCHGSRGDSAGPSTPRLNGQKAEYIIARLQDFLNSTKEAPHASYMVHVVKDIPDSSKAEIAQYFANQIPTEPSPTSQEFQVSTFSKVAIQRRIFQHASLATVHMEKAAVPYHGWRVNMPITLGTNCGPLASGCVKTM